MEGFAEPEVLEDEQRDYCSEPLVIATDKQPPPSLPTPPPKSEPEGCVCKTGKIGIKDSDDVRQGKIDFEDALQNSFFVRRTSSMDARTKRDLPNIEDNNQQQLLEVTSFEELMKLHAEQEEGRSGKPGSFLHNFPTFLKRPKFNLFAVKQAFYREVKENRLVVRDLKYFTKYRVNVRACRALIEKENFTYPHCSLNNVFYVRTRKDGESIETAFFRNFDCMFALGFYRFGGQDSRFDFDPRFGQRDRGGNPFKMGRARSSQRIDIDLPDRVPSRGQRQVQTRSRVHHRPKICRAKEGIRFEFAAGELQR